MADVGKVLQQALLLQGRELYAAHGHRALVPPVAPHQQRRQGGFPAAGFPHQGHKAALGTFQIHPGQDVPPLPIGEAHPLAAQGAVLGHRLAAPFLLRQVQQPEDFLAGCHAVHGDVEERAQQPHGQKEIRRKDKQQQAARQVHAAPLKLGHRQNHPQGRAAIGNQVHDGDGVQLHGQHLHGDFPELLRLLLHLLLLKAVRLVDFQSGQPLQVLQEGVAQGGVLPPVFGEQLLGPPLHRHNGGGNQRHAEEQHQRRREVHKAEHAKQRQGRQHGVKELGQVRAEIRLQLVHALHGHLHHLRGVHPLLVRGPQAQQLFVDFPPQRALHRLGGKVAQAAGEQGAYRPHCHSHHSIEQDFHRHLCCQLPLGKGSYQRSKGSHQPNVRQQGDPLAQHVPCDVFPAFGHRPHKPFVQHSIHPLSENSLG